MRNIFSASQRLPHLAKLGLALGLPLLAGQALAQTQSVIPTTPTSIFGLGYNAVTGATFIATLNPGNLNNTGALITNFLNIDLTGIVAGQRLVAIDARPSTGLLYALGYDNTKTTGNARLYTVALNAANTGYVISPVGTTPVLLTLDLQDPSKGAPGSTANTIDFTTIPRTPPQLTNIGFDFNPRVDRIRVVGPRSSNTASTAGITYVLNPNTGDLTSPLGTPVTGIATSPIGIGPTYVGAVAYTNSAFGVAGTTLYDLGINNTNGSVSTQNITTGVLTQQSVLSFATLNNAGTAYSTFAELNSPTIRLDLDFYYDRGGRRNVAYLLEARRNPANNGYSSNLYTLDSSTGQTTSGQAVGRNIYGLADTNTNPGASFIYDIAALSTSPKVWIGKSATNPTAWNDDANWYPSGQPTASDDVLIPGNGTFVAFGSGYTVTTQPIINTRANATTTPVIPASEALSVTLTNGALLTTANGGTLNVYGDFVNTDSQVAGSGDGVIALVGTAAVQDISGNVPTNFWNLSVGVAGTTTSGATTSGASAFRRALTAVSNLAIGTGQTFTLLSSASGTAYLVNSGSGTVTGAATVQRYITPTNSGSGYRHYSSPVSGNTVADFTTTGYSPIANDSYNTAANPRQFQPYPNIFTYDQARLATSNQRTRWVILTTGSSCPLAPAPRLP